MVSFRCHDMLLVSTFPVLFGDSLRRRTATSKFGFSDNVKVLTLLERLFLKIRPPEMFKILRGMRTMIVFFERFCPSCSIGAQFALCFHSDQNVFPRVNALPGLSKNDPQAWKSRAHRQHSWVLSGGCGTATFVQSYGACVHETVCELVLELCTAAGQAAGGL